MNPLKRLFKSSAPPDVPVAAMTIPQHRLATLRPGDVFLISYPRSGNTWVRRLLYELLLAERGSLPPEQTVSLLVPDLHVGDAELVADPGFGLPHRLFKSHNIRDFLGRRMVYIFRQPADALISYYHFHLRHHASDPKLQNGPDAFCLRMAAGWNEHVQFALEAQRQSPENVVLISYEMLHHDTAGALKKAARFSAIPHSEESIDASVERNKFSRLQAAEAQNPANPKELFFRKGVQGSSAEELQPETLRALEQLSGGIYSEAIERVAMPDHV